ncbi:MAG: hypothetical protein KC656_28420, partial [Myxococcales bacterium]|nr:hypothetical protein [Myxococcales bacterium]
DHHHAHDHGHHAHDHDHHEDDHEGPHLADAGAALLGLATVLAVAGDHEDGAGVLAALGDLLGAVGPGLAVGLLVHTHVPVRLRGAFWALLLGLPVLGPLAFAPALVLAALPEPHPLHEPAGITGSLLGGAVLASLLVPVLPLLAGVPAPLLVVAFALAGLLPLCSAWRLPLAGVLLAGGLPGPAVAAATAAATPAHVVLAGLLGLATAAMPTLTAPVLPDLWRDVGLLGVLAASVHAMVVVGPRGLVSRMAPGFPAP